MTYNEVVVEADYMIRNVAPLYRKAILASIRAQMRSRKAFYDLRDILRKQMEKEPTNEALKLEYQVLYRTTENFCGKPDKSFQEALDSNPSMRKIVWDMIDLLYLRRLTNDAATAFTYLSGLMKLESLGTEQGTIDRNVSKRRLQVVEIAWRMTSNDGESYAENGKVFRDVFRWFVGSKNLLDLGIQLESNSCHTFGRNPDVCILAPDDRDTAADKIVQTLVNTCGLDAVRAFADGGGDIIGGNLGLYILDYMFAVVASSKTVIVIENSSSSNWRKLKPVLTELLTVNGNRVCLVTEAKIDRRNTGERYIKHWPAFVLNDECNDLCVAYNLFKTMFLIP